jgi:hypothetical protein
MALTQTYSEYTINGRKVLLPPTETNQVNSRAVPVPITPYIVLSGVLDLTSSFKEVYSITVPVATYVMAITVLPSSSNVTFLLYYGDYSIGSAITNASSTTSIEVSWSSPFFPLIPSGAVIQLLAASSGTGDTIQFALQGFQSQIIGSL